MLLGISNLYLKKIKNKLSLSEVRAFALFPSAGHEGYYLRLPQMSHTSAKQIPRGFIDIDLNEKDSFYMLMHLGYLINSFDCIIGFTKLDNSLYEGYDFENYYNHPLNHLLRIKEWICGITRERFIDRRDLLSLEYYESSPKPIYSLQVEILGESIPYYIPNFFKDWIIKDAFRSNMIFTSGVGGSDFAWYTAYLSSRIDDYSRYVADKLGYL